MTLDDVLKANGVTRAKLQRSAWCLNQAMDIKRRIDAKRIEKPLDTQTAALVELLIEHVPKLLAVSRASIDHVEHFKSETRALLR